MKDNKDVDSLNHTTWNCQYHVVFVPKYRRMVIYGQIKKDIGQILRQLCEQKGIEIIEAEACPDHSHMLISFPPKYSVAQVMGYIKGKISLVIFNRYANLKYNYGNRRFRAIAVVLTLCLSLLCTPLASAGSVQTADCKTSTAAVQTIAASKRTEEKVWIPTHGGKKYHSKSSCSNMKDPEKVTLSEAKAEGFTACKKCY